MATRSRKRTTSRPTRARQRARPKSRAAGPRRQKRHDPQTLRLRNVTPGFTVNDLRRSERFYTDVLGFVVGERWKDDAGHETGVMLKAGACELGLSQDDWAKGRDRVKGVGVRIWAQTVQDIDALGRRIAAAGWKLTEAPHDQPLGGRALSLDDPDGYHLTVFSRA
ncbi:MAG TPA: VOC family protein [Vicinamibacteria bacterium]|nr:VOC family protein [Vicinamibacteria bacterium]